MFFLPLVSALQLILPQTQITSENNVNITWTSSAGDPATFDLGTHTYFFLTRMKDLKVEFYRTCQRIFPLDLRREGNRPDF